MDEALEQGDFIYLINELINTNYNLKCTEHDDKTIELNEENIQLNYPNAFKALTKRSMDIPIHSCVSCEKICFRRDVTDINNFRKPLKVKSWLELMEYIREQNLECDYVCHYCLSKFRENKMPQHVF